jgi:hypothetical protein
MAVSVSTTQQDVYPPRVQVSVTGLTIGDTVVLYRAVGSVRTLVRDGSMDAVGATAFLRVDAELPFGVPVSYVASVNNTEYTTSATTYSLPSDKVALSDAVTGLAAEVVISAWPEKQYDSDFTTFRVAGRKVVVTGGIDKGFEGQIELVTDTDSQRDNLLNLIQNATQGTIQIRQGGSWSDVDCYVTVTSVNARRDTQQFNNVTDQRAERRYLTLTVVEVEPWDSAFTSHEFTLQDIADHYDTLTLLDLSNDYATLLDVAQGDWS